MVSRTLMLLIPLSLVACDQQQPEPVEVPSESPKDARPKSETHGAVTNVSVEQLSAWLVKGEAVPVDANSAETRTKVGVIPKSVLLSKSSDFARNELPADKSTKLVFYCYNKRCSAAPNAAEHAMEAGYKDVNVLPVGITGWVGAGKAVSKPNT